jgi:hypothetical protein
MSLRTYYERQAATSRRLAAQAVTREVAQRLLVAANDYEQRAKACDNIALSGEHSDEPPAEAH